MQDLKILDGYNLECTASIYDQLVCAGGADLYLTPR